MKFRLLALGVLLVWGFIKMPWESALDAEQRKLTLGATGQVTMEMRDKLGQGLTLAALGGFRGLAATAVWLLLHNAWEDGDWAWLRTYAELGVLLQPRDTYFWENASWHLAYNASIGMQNDAKDLTPDERRKESRRWVDEGIKMLQRGIQANPEKGILYERLAELYQQRLGDYRKAAHYYELAAECPDGAKYLPRFAGYMLLKAGDDQQAYEYWKKIWPKLSAQERSSSQWGRVRQEIKKLEEKLNLPRQDRILMN